MLVTNFLGEAIILGLVRLGACIVDRAQQMRFVENDQVPLEILQQRALVLRPLERIDRRDGRGFQIPDAWVDSLKVPLEDFKVRAKLVLHLFLPLKGQPGWSKNQSATSLTPLG